MTPLIARIFPQGIRNALVQASQIERSSKGPGESLDRTLAVEEATRKARRECPHLFKNEDRSNA